MSAPKAYNVLVYRPFQPESEDKLRKARAEFMGLKTFLGEKDPHVTLGSRWQVRSPQAPDEALKNIVSSSEVRSGPIRLAVDDIRWMQNNPPKVSINALFRVDDELKQEQQVANNLLDVLYPDRRKFAARRHSSLPPDTLHVNLGRLTCELELDAAEARFEDVYKVLEAGLVLGGLTASYQVHRAKPGLSPPASPPNLQPSPEAQQFWAALRAAAARGEG